MSIYDKVIYYCGIFSIILSIGFIIAGALGAFTDMRVAIGKGIVGLIVGAGLFARGSRAKHQAEVKEVLRHLDELEEEVQRREQGKPKI